MLPCSVNRRLCELLGCQGKGHMRLTDVEDAPDASPRESNPTNPPHSGGPMNAGA